MHRILFLALVSSLVLLIANQAAANSRFTVQNDSDRKVTIGIFNGDDGTCTVSIKVKSVNSGETESYGCAGGGKHRCKLSFQYGSSNSSACDDLYDTCQSQTVKVANGETVVITDLQDCRIGLQETR